MFSIHEIKGREGVIQYRREHLTDLRCRVSTERIKRGLDTPFVPAPPPPDCPFCPGRVMQETPTFPNGSRITVGESITFPNLYPFAKVHTVTVITKAHSVKSFTRQQIADALRGQCASLKDAHGFPSINWNSLPSAGASIMHPHLQGIVDDAPTAIGDRYLRGSRRYAREKGRNYWEDLVSHERRAGRYLFGDGIAWLAGAVPLGEREIRAVLPVQTLQEFERCIDEFSEGLVRVLSFYASLGTRAFNLSIFFDEEEGDTGFSAFCIMIARINPSPASISDTAFMERLHLEPVI
ncbi:MAG: galactose-1-phosphate uridylyltransferase, partial [Methanomicrobiaceae archaeon]|nr:galactose-1-phosphate uridylyltransferase [Methanomicrobiaceae archaeon]